MIKKIIPLVTLVLSGSAIAQIGIGTKKPASSAQLDIVSSSKGVLLPRIELLAVDDRSKITGDIVESLLVYHTGNSNLVAGFYYWKGNAWNQLLSADTYIDRKNNTFTIGANPTKNGEESLIITDTENHSVYLPVADIANNTTFIENLVENQEFITKLGDNIEFIEHITNNNKFVEEIINNLKGAYGNVSYDATTNTFFYFDANGDKQNIDWSVLNTTNVTFTLEGDYLIVRDSEGHPVSLAVSEIANNSTFIENLVKNQEFITKLGDNIDFIEHITNNNKFVEEIINNLKGAYGNVSYDATTNTFFYFDANGDKQNIDWSVLNTTNVTFTLEGDYLIVRDSEGHPVSLAVSEIANNSTFIENLVKNQEFITQLGDNIDFIEHITNNNKFVEEIINNLKGAYGNVSYDATTNTFFYFDANGDKQNIDWSVLNTTNVTFTLEGDYLIVRDSEGHPVSLAVSEIANNSTFIENLVKNQEFITKLGDNIDFIEHITNNNKFVEEIINNLKGVYGNVSYDATTNTFFYFDANGDKQNIDWSVLNTTNVTFTLEADYLIVRDSEGHPVSLAVSEIANNSTFIENLVKNQEFITKLGDNIDFIEQITNNNKFIEEIINNLKGTYGNVGYDTTSNSFFYYDEHGAPTPISWDDLSNTKIATFDVDADNLTITDTDGVIFAVPIDKLGKIIANNDVFVTELVDNQEFITKLGNKVEFIEQITNNNKFIEEIINNLKGTYGNVGYDTTSNSFFYYDEHGTPTPISWDDLSNTKIATFDVDADNLTITDTDGVIFAVPIDKLGKIIANNDVFVTELVDNQEFITKLGNKVEFIEQITNNNKFIEEIINNLKGTYGNVGYDTTSNSFFYYDEHGTPTPISWDDLSNTKIATFDVDADNLTITDTDGVIFAVPIDKLGKIIANNDVFVTELVDNQEFITKLGNKVEFIEQITNNNKFIEEIINNLKGTYGNVGYDTTSNSFFYYDEHGTPTPISWDDLSNTKIATFDVDADNLTITDTDGVIFAVPIDKLGKIIANNDVFVTELVDNQEFITKLGNKVEFIEQITNNNKFIEEIINNLKGTYGNVGYDTTSNSFFYYDEHGTPTPISWDDLSNTKIATFDVDADNLTITDTDGVIFAVPIDKLGKIIANNDVFVTELVDNQEFITKLGNKVEFIEQITNNNKFIEEIINNLKGTYGNVGYDTTSNSFFYYDEHGTPTPISWDDLSNTKIATFDVDADNLTITDTDGVIFAVPIDKLGKIIANNDVFVTELVDNQEFITKLGNKVEFIEQITNNNKFIEEIINNLKGTYGNVGYDTTSNSFFYYDEHGTPTPISWDDLSNTKIATFDVDADNLTITDTDGVIFAVPIDKLGKIIANNDVFVTELVDNQEFITKLGNKVEFIEQITNNNKFIEEIINNLKGTYGNVGYDTTSNSFFYYDEHGTPTPISWDDLSNTKIATFDVDADNLTITDTDGVIFAVPIDKLGKIIANNDVFVTELVDNQEFITKLGNKVEFIEQITNNNEFIENIIKELKGTYGNVGYDTVNNTFFYYDENKQPVVISWDAFIDTKIKSFGVTDEFLTIIDTGDKEFAIAIDDLGKIIANNDVFVTELVDNQEFITKLGDNQEFKEIINTNSVVSTLALTNSTVNSNEVLAGFTFNNGRNPSSIQFSETLTAMAKGKDINELIEYYFIDETGKRDDVIIQVTQDIITDFEKIINDTTVKTLLKEFISTATGDVSVIRNGSGDIIITTSTDSFNLSNEIRNKETNTVLTSVGAGVYVYKNEEAIKNNGAGVTINVVSDVQNNFEEIINKTEVKEILNKYITGEVEGNVTYKNDKFYVTVKNGNVYETTEIDLSQFILNNAKTLTTDGVIEVTVNGVAGIEATEAVLKPLTLSIKNDAITTAHIKDETLLVGDFANSTPNTLFATDNTGKPYWMEKSQITESINVGSGLSYTNSQIQLGGSLTAPTTITANSTNTLIVKGLELASNTDYVVMADQDGVLKQMKAAMPKFFYMPSVVMPTAADQINSIIMPNITHANGVYTVDLYANYTSQFGTPKVTSQAGFTLPVLPASELVFNITWFDPTVFTDVNVTADGKLTYKISPTGDVTIGSFMNIVFAVK